MGTPNPRNCPSLSQSADTLKGTVRSFSASPVTPGPWRTQSHITGKYAASTSRNRNLTPVKLAPTQFLRKSWVLFSLGAGWGLWQDSLLPPYEVCCPSRTDICPGQRGREPQTVPHTENSSQLTSPDRIQSQDSGQELSFQFWICSSLSITESRFYPQEI